MMNAEVDNLINQVKGYEADNNMARISQKEISNRRNMANDIKHKLEELKE